MKKFRVYITVVSTIIFTSAYSQVQFSEIDFREAVQKAKSENKLLMVDAYTEWCGWCKVMDKKTFSQPNVGEYVNPRFVSIKIDMEMGFGIDLAMKYRVSSYPHYLFFNGDGNLIGRFGGFVEPEPYLAMMEEIVNPNNYLNPLPEPMNFDLGFPEFYRNSFKKRKDRSYPSPEELQVFLDQHQEVTDELTWAVVSRFVNNGPYTEKIFSNKDELIQKYGKEEIMAKLSRIIFSDVKEAIKDSSQFDFELSLEKADRVLGEEAEPYKRRYRLYYFQMNKQWDNYADVGTELSLEKSEDHAGSLNQIGWNLYEKSDSEYALNSARKWMKQVVGQHPTYAYFDTYAAILYKLGEKNEAQAAVDKAIQLAIQEEVDHDETLLLKSEINALP